MKITILKILAMLLLAGSFSSCSDDDIDMSEIDFGNIEDLYAQPLPVIEKCVQGKWKWIESCGGYVGCRYVDNTFVDIKKDHVVIDYADGTQGTFYFTYKKRLAYCVGNEEYTYVMWNKDNNEAFWYFTSIKNDTLSVGHSPLTGNYPRFESSFVRIK